MTSLLSGENTVAAQGPKARGIPAWGNAPGVEPTPIQGLKARPLLCHSFCPHEACHPRVLECAAGIDPDFDPDSDLEKKQEGLRMWEAPPCGDFSTYDHQAELFWLGRDRSKQHHVFCGIRYIFNHERHERSRTAETCHKQNSIFLVQSAEP